MHKDVEKILFSYEDITKKTAELGEILTNEYKDQCPVLVGLLKGSVPFLAEIIRHIDTDLEIDFMDVSSYEGTESSGDVRILKDLECSVKGRRVLIVEDIVDTGKTLSTVKDLIYQKGAIDVRIITLLNKVARRELDVHVDYKCFDVDNEFVIGFGLDYNEKYRNLPYVGVIKEEAI